MTELVHQNNINGRNDEGNGTKSMSEKDKEWMQVMTNVVESFSSDPKMNQAAETSVQEKSILLLAQADTSVTKENIQPANEPIANSEQDSIISDSEVTCTDQNIVLAATEDPIVKEESDTICLGFVKQEMETPATVHDINIDQFLKEVSDGYQQCQFHLIDMLEKNLVCIDCQQLICALCLRDHHVKHTIISIGRLREYKNIMASMEEDVSHLQLLQESFSRRFQERHLLKRQVENSTKALLEKINKAFEQLNRIILEKQKEVCDHVRSFERNHLELLSKELNKIRRIESMATKLITDVMTYFSRLDLKSSTELPQRLNRVIEECKKFQIEELECKEIYMPEEKFSKILPALQAVSNICKTIHPEGTTVKWSKVKLNKQTMEQNEDKEVKVNRKRASSTINTTKKTYSADISDTSTTDPDDDDGDDKDSQEDEKDSQEDDKDSQTETTSTGFSPVFKKPRIVPLIPLLSTRESRSKSSPSPPSSPSVAKSRQSNTVSSSVYDISNLDLYQVQNPQEKREKLSNKTIEKKSLNTPKISKEQASLLDKGASVSLQKKKEESPKSADSEGSKLRKQGRLTNARGASLLSSSSSSKSKTAEKDDQGLPQLGLIDFDVMNMKKGSCVMINSSDNEKWIGRIADVTSLHESKHFNVQWFEGVLGNKQFKIARNWQRKFDKAHIDNTICHFEYNHENSMPSELINQLKIAAKQNIFCERQEKTKKNENVKSSAKKKTSVTESETDKNLVTKKDRHAKKQ